MKINKITLAIIVFVIGYVFTKAADNPINQIFEKYAGKEGFTSVNISKDMFDMFKDISKDEKNNKSMSEVVDGLEGIKILTYSPDKKKSKQKFDFYNEIIKNIPISSYTSLMDVNEENTFVKFLIKKDSKGKISEFLMLVNEENEGTLIWITGELDLNKIKKLSKDMN
ncbi:MAG: DUF4252 domain-containing protein, partial [Ignavibacteriae bacterium]|nr:DUF4252 domain-containing protein [Ignavibacteriota bacterium]